MFVLSTNMYSFFNLSLNAVIEKGSHQRKSVCQLHVHYQYKKTATQFELSAKIIPGELDGHLLISYLTVFSWARVGYEMVNSLVGYFQSHIQQARME